MRVKFSLKVFIFHYKTDKAESDFEFNQENYLLKPKHQYPLEECNRIQRLTSESIYELRNIYISINCIKILGKMSLN